MIGQKLFPDMFQIWYSLRRTCFHQNSAGSFDHLDLTILSRKKLRKAIRHVCTHVGFSTHVRLSKIFLMQPARTFFAHSDLFLKRPFGSRPKGHCTLCDFIHVRCDEKGGSLRPSLNSFIVLTCYFQVELVRIPARSTTCINF